MTYIYPVIITPADGGYDVHAPDLFGCRTCGDTLGEALDMAQDALSTWLWVSEQNYEKIPEPSLSVTVQPPGIVSLIKADTDAIRRKMDSRAVKKTLSLPAWLNNKAEAANINFSRVLQDALKTRLNIES
ncbi:MAG: type II toxin-antitoxin system HicB family antitoxin [Oscillospiraceae bacterium]|nr:type II toxin-antitoxin system HicB family antitoxin [Oscillospiraceae bacterium]